MSRLAAALLLALLLAGGAPDARAERDPSTRHLLLAGAAMAPPTYFAGVFAHEGSHALVARLLGAEVVEFGFLPGRYGPSRDFHFGYVSVRGRLTPGQLTAFWLAPKATDAVLVGAYSAALAAGAMPRSRYGRLALTVLATGFWVDFSKDALAFWDSNDLVKAYNMNGLDSELSRLPFRLLHLGLSAAGAYALYRGYRGVFDGRREDPTGAALVIPLFGAPF